MGETLLTERAAHGLQLTKLASARRAVVIVACCALNGGCVTSSMQGYADRELPRQTVQRVAVYIAAPGPLASQLHSSVQQEAATRGLSAQDMLAILPPTRTYSDAEMRQALVGSRVDAILVINVGDTGVVREYAGTFLSASYSGSSNYSGSAARTANSTDISLSGNSSGKIVGSATPMYRYNRQTNFAARLVDPRSGRNLWVGSGQVNAGGLLFVGDSTSANNTARTIFNDLDSKGLLGSASS